MSFDKGFHDDNEVFSISKPCEVGKIKNDKRTRKKNVAKTTIMNIATIIKIKILIVFTLIILKLLSNKALNRTCVFEKLESRIILLARNIVEDMSVTLSAKIYFVNVMVCS
jgi:hypothetical protein